MEKVKIIIAQAHRREQASRSGHGLHKCTHAHYKPMRSPTQCDIDPNWNAQVHPCALTLGLSPDRGKI